MTNAAQNKKSLFHFEYYLCGGMQADMSWHESRLFYQWIQI